MFTCSIFLLFFTPLTKSLIILLFHLCFICNYPVLSVNFVLCIHHPFWFQSLVLYCESNWPFTFWSIKHYTPVKSDSVDLITLVSTLLTDVIEDSESFWPPIALVWLCISSMLKPLYHDSSIHKFFQLSVRLTYCTFCTMVSQKCYCVKKKKRYIFEKFQLASYFPH